MNETNLAAFLQVEGGMSSKVASFNTAEERKNPLHRTQSAIKKGMDVFEAAVIDLFADRPLQNN